MFRRALGNSAVQVTWTRPCLAAFTSRWRRGWHRNEDMKTETKKGSAWSQPPSSAGKPTAPSAASPVESWEIPRPTAPARSPRREAAQPCQTAPAQSIDFAAPFVGRAPPAQQYRRQEAQLASTMGGTKTLTYPLHPHVSHTRSSGGCKCNLLCICLREGNLAYMALQTDAYQSSCTPYATLHKQGGKCNSPVQLELRPTHRATPACCCAISTQGPYLPGQPHKGEVGGMGRREDMAVQGGHSIVLHIDNACPF